jgi:hypothetical protein
MIRRIHGRVAREAAVAVLLSVGSVATFLRDVQVGRVLPDHVATKYLATVAVFGAAANVLTLWALASDWRMSRRLFLPIIVSVAALVGVEAGALGSRSSSISLISATTACCLFQMIVNLALANGPRSRGMVALLVAGVIGPLAVPVALSVGGLQSQSASRFVLAIAIYLAVQALMAIRVMPPHPGKRSSSLSRAPWILGWSIAVQLVAVAGRLITTRDAVSGTAILGAHVWTAVFAGAALSSLFIWRAGSPDSPVGPRFRRLSVHSLYLYPVVGAGALVLGVFLLPQIGSVIGAHLTTLDYVRAIWPPLASFVPLVIMSFFVRMSQPEFFRNRLVRGWTMLCLAAIAFVALDPGLGRWASVIPCALLIAGAGASYLAVGKSLRGVAVES